MPSFLNARLRGMGPYGKLEWLNLTIATRKWQMADFLGHLGTGFFPRT